MLKQFFILIFFSYTIYGFQINELKFDKKIKVGETATKEYVLYNNEDTDIMYRISAKEDKNIKIVPNVLKLKKNERKTFKIIAKGRKKGQYRYNLTLEEINTNKNVKNAVKVLKNIKIQHNYSVE